MILCSVIPLPQCSTGQLVQAHIKSRSVVPSAYSAHSGAVTVCSRSRAGAGEHTALATYPLNHLHNWTVIKPHSPFEKAFVFNHCVSSSDQFVLCVSELFTLLRTRNLKSCSMGCSSPIVDQCTCPLLVLQVSMVLSVPCNGQLLWNVVQRVFRL